MSANHIDDSHILEILHREKNVNVNTLQARKVSPRPFSFLLSQVKDENVDDSFFFPTRLNKAVTAADGQDQLFTLMCLGMSL